MEQIPQLVKEIVKEIATTENITNYEIGINDPNKKGEGFMGELVFISVIDQDTRKILLDLVLKKSQKSLFIRNRIPVNSLFYNEVYFYNSIWKNLCAFQDVYKIKRIFTLAKCFTYSIEDMNEYVVLENLKSKGYRMFNKHNLLNKDQFKYIFRQYAKFHAVGFAYKTLNPEKFKNLEQNILPTLDNEQDGFKENANNLCTKIYNVLSLEDETIGKEFKKYSSYGWDIYKQTILDYNGKYGTFLHGDSWNNNMMFTFDDQENIVDMTLIDFQIIRCSSPVFDLSYIIYSGATIEILDCLDELLDAYYEALSEMLEKFDLKAKDIYPLSSLKEEWRMYCKSAMVFSFLIWKVRMRSQDEMMDLNDMSDKKNYEKMMALPKNPMFMKIIKDLIMHVHNLNAL